MMKPAGCTFLQKHIPTKILQCERQCKEAELSTRKNRPRQEQSGQAPTAPFSSATARISTVFYFPVLLQDFRSLDPRIFNRFNL